MATKVTKTTTPRKTAAKSIQPNKDVQALMKAIATGDTDGVDLEALQEVLSNLGLQAVAKGSSGEKGSRIERVRKWLTAEPMDEEGISIIKALPEVIGEAPIITGEDDVRDFTQDEIDLVVDELDHIRPTVDVAKGRGEVLRRTALNIISFRNGGDPYATGELLSLKKGRKLVIGLQNKTPDADLNDLKEIVDAATWESITVEVTERVVSEELVAEAMAEGKITVENFQAIQPEPNLVRTMTVKDIKKGDEV